MLPVTDMPTKRTVFDHRLLQILSAVQMRVSHTSLLEWTIVTPEQQSEKGRL